MHLVLTSLQPFWLMKSHEIQDSVQISRLREIQEPTVPWGTGWKSHQQQPTVPL